MLTQPLQFEPGGRYAYSNFGYCLLGRVIEHVAAVPYEHYVQRNVLAPLGIHRMRLAKTLLADRLPTEVAYYDEKNRTDRAVVGDIDRRVPLPYGAWSLEIMDANGGWLASAPDLARFASVFYETAACPILRPETIGLMFARPEGEAGVEVEGNYYGCGWFVWPNDTHAHRAHSSSNGVIAGTSSYLMRRYDGIAWAALFNRARGNDDQPLSIKFRDASAAPISRVREWPLPDQFGHLL